MHRIGRSGRFGHYGLAINFIGDGDRNNLFQIEQVCPAGCLGYFGLVLVFDLLGWRRSWEPVLRRFPVTLTRDFTPMTQARLLLRLTKLQRSFPSWPLPLSKTFRFRQVVTVYSFLSPPSCDHFYMLTLLASYKLSRCCIPVPVWVVLLRLSIEFDMPTHTRVDYCEHCDCECE